MMPALNAKLHVMCIASRSISDQKCFKCVRFKKCRVTDWLPGLLNLGGGYTKLFLVLVFLGEGTTARVYKTPWQFSELGVRGYKSINPFFGDGSSKNRSNSMRSAEATCSCVQADRARAVNPPVVAKGNYRICVPQLSPLVAQGPTSD